MIENKVPVTSFKIEYFFLRHKKKILNRLKSDISNNVGFIPLKKCFILVPETYRFPSSGNDGSNPWEMLGNELRLL